MIIRKEQIIDKGYEVFQKTFQWNIPHDYNIANDVCDRHAAKNSNNIALYLEDGSGLEKKVTYARLKELSDRFANYLTSKGIKKGDRVAIMLPQKLETVIAHLGIYKTGAIAVPLSILFGPEALSYRLNDSACKAVVVSDDSINTLFDIWDELEFIETAVIVGDSKSSIEGVSFDEIINKASPNFSPVAVNHTDPAIIIYTSGTTGKPKGTLHSHQVLIGHIPAVQLFFDLAPQPDDVFWTPADWAWIGGAFDLLFPGLLFGGPVVGTVMGKFDPEKAFHYISKYQVTCSFMPATALKMLMQVPNPKQKYDIKLRVIGSGGEAVNPVIHQWYKEYLNVPINEFYGQTEANLLVGNCSKVLAVKPGSMGKPYPGHKVEVIDEEGNVLPPGEPGEVALDPQRDPVAFLEYWNNPEATKEKYLGKWLITGDMASKDKEGYLWFEGRKDDVIISAGYRIGPTEIESTLLQHPAVSEAAAIGSPDELRGEVVKAFIKLKAGFSQTDELKQEIRMLVKSKLSTYAYPRELEFIEQIPLTTTGKIKRKELREMDKMRKES